MPVKLRVAKNLRPRVLPEALQLFAKLERQPPSARSKEDVRELARMLDLEDEWFCCGQTVLDRELTPCYPPSKGAYDTFFRVRAMREYLLEQLATYFVDGMALS